MPTLEIRKGNRQNPPGGEGGGCNLKLNGECPADSIPG